jgi:hypothetical protein
VFTISRPRSWLKAEGRERSLSISEYIAQLNSFSFNGHQYGYGGIDQTLPGKPQEPIANNFVGYVQGAYKQNGIVFACILARMSLFSQGRFQFRRLRNGQALDLFGNKTLRKLEVPWPGAKTANLLARMEQDVSLAGNSFTLDRGRAGLRRLRPDWTNIALGNPDPDITPDALPWHPDTEVVGYAYTPGGMYSGYEPIVYRPELVAHYAPIPDPEAAFRGISWVVSVVLDVLGDKAATEHKLSFLESGGTPNMTVEYDPQWVKDEEAFKAWREAIETQIAAFGPSNRRLHLGGGTKATVVGNNFAELELKATQGAGETRIAMAAGVPAVVLGSSEGLQGSSLNAGNYQASMRRFSDMTIRWLWENAAGSLQKLIAVPTDAELWVDDRHVSALQADRTDAATIQQSRSVTITTYVREGFEPDSAVAAVVNDDETLLKHSGLPPVQVQAPPANNGGGTPAENQQAVDQAAN